MGQTADRWGRGLLSKSDDLAAFDQKAAQTGVAVILGQHRNSSIHQGSLDSVGLGAVAANAAQGGGDLASGPVQVMFGVKHGGQRGATAAIKDDGNVVPRRGQFGSEAKGTLVAAFRLRRGVGVDHDGDLVVRIRCHHRLLGLGIQQSWW